MFDHILCCKKPKYSSALKSKMHGKQNIFTQKNCRQRQFKYLQICACLQVWHWSAWLERHPQTFLYIYLYHSLWPLSCWKQYINVGIKTAWKYINYFYVLLKTNWKCKFNWIYKKKVPEENFYHLNKVKLSFEIFSLIFTITLVSKLSKYKYLSAGWN